MHEHLRQVGAVRLVLGLVEHELHRADDADRVLGDEERALAALHAVGHAPPERQRGRRDSGCMKLTDAPPSTQSIRTSASSAI